MSKENVEALKRVYSAWGAGDLAAEVSLFDPYLVAVFPDPEPVPLYGLEAIQTYIRELLATWKNPRFPATRYRECEGVVVVNVQRLGTGKHSGLEMEDEVFHVWTFRGGQAVRLDVFGREQEALEAAGLCEVSLPPARYGLVTHGESGNPGALTHIV